MRASRGASHIPDTHPVTVVWASGEKKSVSAKTWLGAGKGEDQGKNVMGGVKSRLRASARVRALTSIVKGVRGGRMGGRGQGRPLAG